MRSVHSRGYFPRKRLSLFIVVSILVQFVWSDAGAQMRKIFQDVSNPENEIEKISFYSPNEGYVAFSRWIGYTSDSGRTFTKKQITLWNVDYNNHSVNLTFGFGINGIKAFNRDTLIAYGEYGLVPAILYSTNGGNTFKLVYHSQFRPLEFLSGITDMVFPENNQIGYAIDADRVLKTTNRGISWSVVRTDPASYFAGIEGLSNSSVYVYNSGYGARKLLHTTDGGTSWQLLSIPSGHIEHASFLSTGRGWLSVREGNIGNLYYTNNNGLIWNRKNDSDATPFFSGRMKFIDDSTGYAVMGLFTVYKTTDSGKVWQPLPRDNSFEYLGYSHNDVQIWDKNLIWAGGGHGFLEISTNGGGVPLPKAYFKIDTSRLSTNQTIDLVNLSKPGYQYRWFKNDVLISNSYHASYTQDPTRAIDNIKLVVSNGIFSDTLVQQQRFNITPPPPPPLPFTGWELKPTNINDNLQDVRVLGNYGVLIGENGIYYTTTGISNSNGWRKFSIASPSEDSLLFTRIKFRQLAFNNQTPVFYLCGNETPTDKAVLFKIDLRNMEFKFLYIGQAGTRLNSIIMADAYNSMGYLVAVGNNGLVVNYSLADNTASTAYITDRRDLMKIFFRPGNNIPAQLGILADSVLYVGNYGAGLRVAYSQNLGRRVTDGESMSGAYDLLIHKTTPMLYHSYSSSGHLSLNSITNVKPANLQYNTIAAARIGLHRFIGTNKGIYKVTLSSANLNNAAIEYQPTSLGRPVNSIWFNPLLDTGYAVGPNGFLLQTANYGGPTVPFADIKNTGNCLGSDTWLGGSHGTGTSCKWYIDNVFKADACNSYGVRFTNVGYYNIRYVVSNVYGLADTAYKTIYISPVPNINLPIELSDSILCKSEPVSITIKNTEANFSYELIQESNGKVVGSVNSHGGQVVLNSVPLNESGMYFIRVTRNGVACIRDFTNKIWIRVEHTKSNFVGDRINIIPGEKINYFQRSLEAASFAWRFHDDASISGSTVVNPQNISYTSTGQKTVSLISMSQHGCADTTTANAVFVYSGSVPDEKCYVQTINDSDFHYFPDSPADMGKLTYNPRDNGYFISGFGNRPLINSRHGLSKQYTTNSTAYFAKFTRNGVLGWVNYLSPGGKISSSAVDQDGNIYVLGNCSVHGYYYFNNGDSLAIATTEPNPVSYHKKRNGFILKLDANGKYLWHTVIDDPTPEYSGYPVDGGYENKIKIRDNHIIINGRFLANLAYYRNGSSQKIISLPNENRNDLQNEYILKIKNDGSLLWHAYLENESVNQIYGINDVGIDKLGNVYFAGRHEQRMTFFDAGKINTVIFQGQVANSYGYFIRLDPSGRLAGKVKLKTNFGFSDIAITALSVSDEGSCYLTGTARGLKESEYFEIIQDDESINRVSLSSYFLLKFDATGMYKWGVGNRYSYYGRGHSVLLDGNDIYTTLTLSENGQAGSIFVMTSMDSSELFLKIHNSEFAIANYDTSGVLKRIVKSGISSGGHLKPIYLTIDESKNFLLSGVTDNGNGGIDQFDLFGHQFTTNGLESFFGSLSRDFCSDALAPDADAGADKRQCAGDTTSIGVPAVSGYNYSWRSEKGDFKSAVANPIVSPLVTTNYYLTVNNESGLIDRDTMTITVDPLPIANAGTDKNICKGSETNIGTAQINGNIYQWSSNPPGFVSSFANPLVKPASGTTYYLSVRNGIGCTAYDTAAVSVSDFVVPSVTITASDTEICSGDETIFRASAVHGGNQPIYKWQVNGSEAGVNSSDFSTTTLANGAEVEVILKSSTCADPEEVKSNKIVMVVNPSVSPAISISGTTLVTAGGSSPLLVTIINGGASPEFQWRDSTKEHGWKDINGAISETITYSPKASGDKVLCVLKSNADCAQPALVISNALAFTVSTTTAIDPVPATNFGIRYYPNPVSTTLYIDSLKRSDNWLSLEINDIAGRKVFINDQIQYQTSLSIDVSSYQSGIYIATLRKKRGEVVYFKFVKLN